MTYKSVNAVFRGEIFYFFQPSFTFSLFFRRFFPVFVVTSVVHEPFISKYDCLVRYCVEKVAIVRYDNNSLIFCFIFDIRLKPDNGRQVEMIS